MVTCSTMGQCAISEITLHTATPRGFNSLVSDGTYRWRYVLIDDKLIANFKSCFICLVHIQNKLDFLLNAGTVYSKVSTFFEFQLVHCFLNINHLRRSLGASRRSCSWTLSWSFWKCTLRLRFLKWAIVILSSQSNLCFLIGAIVTLLRLILVGRLSCWHRIYRES